MHQYEDLIALFHDCFLEKHNTQLIRGTDEPLYLPADKENPHNRLFFAHGFYASALHECAHWLIAGEERRKQVDFGYWYVPDGRSPSEQQLFQAAEIKPQAMEWILSAAAKFPFRVSIDNLTGSKSETDSFKLCIYEQVKTYCAKGLPARAEIFRAALCNFYHSPLTLQMEDFNLALLQ